MQWSIIEKTLALGLERIGLHPEIDAFVEKYLPDNSLDDTEKLVAAFGVMHQLKRVEDGFSIWEGPMPQPFPIDADDLFGDHVVFLEKILLNFHENALQEYVELCAHFKKPFPSAYFPKLFDVCLDKPAVFQLLIPMLGDKGVWLLSLKKNWAPLLQQLNDNTTIIEPSITEEELSHLAQFVLPYFHFSMEGKLDLIIPESIPENIILMLSPLQKELGMEATFGPKANCFFQILSRVPLSFWTEQFKSPPLAILKAAASGNSKKLFFEGIAEATLYFKDKDWMEALAQIWSDLPEDAFWKENRAIRLIKSWPDDLFNRICLKELAQEGSIWADGMLATLLQLNSHHYSEKVCISFMAKFQHWLRNSGSPNLIAGRHFLSILKILAYKADPGLHPLFDRHAWPTYSRYWYHWEEEVLSFLSTLQFRKSMHQAFN